MFFLKKSLSKLGMIILLVVLILSFEEVCLDKTSYGIELKIVNKEEVVIFDPLKFHSFKGFTEDKIEKKTNMFTSQAFSPIIYLGYVIIGLGLILEEMEVKR